MARRTKERNQLSDIDIKPEDETVPLPLLVTGEGADSEMRDTLSPSALASFEICGARGQYYKDPNQPRTSSLGTARGRAWHKAMEFWNTNRDTAKLLDPDLLKDALYKEAAKELAAVTSSPEMVWFDGDSAPVALAELWAMVQAFVAADPGTRWDEPGISVLGAEVPVLGDFGSPHHVMPGVIDAVFEVNGDVIGVDYKSAGRAWGGAKAEGDPRKVIQPPLYAAAWAAQNGRPMDWFCMDVMTVKGKFQRIWVPTHPTVREPFVDRWNHMSAQITMHKEQGMNMPTNPGHILCSEKWCNYWEVCPMGAEYEELLRPGTRVPVQVTGETK